MTVHSIVVQNINVLCLSFTGDNTYLTSRYYGHIVLTVIKSSVGLTKDMSDTNIVYTRHVYVKLEEKLQNSFV